MPRPALSAPPATRGRACLPASQTASCPKRTEPMQLSPHFSLAEFTFSDTANAEHIANTPNARHIGAMKVLCAKVLEPLRAQFGQIGRASCRERVCPYV